MSTLTVILPVYNAEKYLAETLDCIQNQSFTDFRVLAMNDGSTDSSLEILKERAKSDSRIQIISRENRGLVSTLNEALAIVNTPYVARHDADDFSPPDRFSKQVQFLKDHPRVGLLGTTFLCTFGAQTDAQFIPTTDAQLRECFPYRNGFAHGSMMAKTSILQKVNGYSIEPSVRHVEDYDLWSRCLKITQVANLPDMLYVYREYHQNTSQKNLLEQIENADRLQKRNARAFLASNKLWNFMRVAFEVLSQAKSNDPFWTQRKRYLKNVLNFSSALLSENGSYFHAHLRRLLASYLD